MNITIADCYNLKALIKEDTSCRLSKTQIIYIKPHSRLLYKIIFSPLFVDKNIDLSNEFASLTLILYKRLHIII